MQDALLDMEINMRYPIGVATPLADLTTEFAHSSAHSSKIGDLVNRGYTRRRRVRGDGNCFYRALGHLWLDGLCVRAAARNASSESLAGCSKLLSMESCRCPGLEEECDDLARAVRALLRGEDASDDEGCWAKYLSHRLMVDQKFDLCLVSVLRQLVATFIVTGGEGECDLRPFLPESAEDFVREVILPMGKEAEGLVMRAAAELLQMHITIVHLDGSSGAAAPEFHFPSEHYSSPIGLSACLLFRPGHYEVLYRAGDATSFADPEDLMGKCSCCMNLVSLRLADLRPCFHHVCETCSSQARRCCPACSRAERRKTGESSSSARDRQQVASSLSDSAQQVLDQALQWMADIPDMAAGPFRRKFSSHGPRIEARQPSRPRGDGKDEGKNKQAELMGCMRSAGAAQPRQAARKNSVRFERPSGDESLVNARCLGEEEARPGDSPRIPASTRAAVTQALERHAALRELVESGAHAGGMAAKPSDVETTSPRCRGAGCSFHGAPAMEGYCSRCFAQRFANQDGHGNKDATLRPMVPDYNPVPQPAQERRAAPTKAFPQKKLLGVGAPPPQAGKQQNATAGYVTPMLHQKVLAGDAEWPISGGGKLAEAMQRRDARMAQQERGLDLDSTERRAQDAWMASPLDETVKSNDRRAHWLLARSYREAHQDGPRRSASARAPVVRR